MPLNKVTIVCTIDGDYARHCAVTLVSLLLNNPEIFFEVYILYNKVSPDNLKKLKTSLLHFSHELHLIPVNESVLGNVPVDHHISAATYYRLQIPQLLPAKIEKVLFLDSDILVRKSIKELWETQLADYSLAAVTAAGMDDYPASILLPATTDYFNAGVMLIDLVQWRSQNILQRSIELLNKEPHRVKWWDQDILNILFEGHCRLLDFCWNAQPYLFRGLNEAPPVILEKYLRYGSLIASTDPAIVHFAGGDKPWSVHCKLPFAHEYFHYLDQTEWKPGWPAKIGKRLARAGRRLYHYIRPAKKYMNE